MPMSNYQPLDHRKPFLHQQAIQHKIFLRLPTQVQIENQYELDLSQKQIR